MAFDRLVRWVDDWARLHPEVSFFAQTGEGDYRPRHMASKPYLSPAEFDSWMAEADAVVAHAGTGTVLKALYLAKPLLVVPRLSRLDETRNDHQVGTARHFAQQGLLQMAEDVDTFNLLLSDLQGFKPRRRLSDEASPELISTLQTFLRHA